MRESAGREESRWRVLSGESCLVDPDMLSTLPPREFRSGIYEIIKYGVIGDARLFDFLERNMQKVLRRERASLAFVIERSIAQKARVVSQDERESGLREILNFGHTFAHALESATRYRKYLHGEAVGWGMIAANSRLAVGEGNAFAARRRTSRKVDCARGAAACMAIDSCDETNCRDASRQENARRALVLLAARADWRGAMRRVEAEEEMLARVTRGRHRLGFP